MTADNMIGWEQDDDGIVVLTMDDPNQSANTMNDLCKRSFVATVDRLYAERDTVTGVVLTSAKKTFFAGGDLRRTITIGPDQADEVHANIELFRTMLRRLETIGKPVVSAINGAVLGGGLEIALATHRRIVAEVPGVKIGFPESTLGLLPGGGGLVRSVRLLGLQTAVLCVLVPGVSRGPWDAKEVGLVDQVVDSVDALVPAAKAWIRENPDGGVQPWDRAGYRIPGGGSELSGNATDLVLPEDLRTSFRGAPIPAHHAIVAAAVEGLQVDFDSAMNIEARAFVSLVTGQIAKNMMQASFFDQQTIRAGHSRPTGVALTRMAKVGVRGAGALGAELAYQSAKAGYEVVLMDAMLDAARTCKSHAEGVETKALSDGVTTKVRSNALLARITPTNDTADLAGVDLVVETRPDTAELEPWVFHGTEGVAERTALLWSTTATVPVTDRVHEDLVCLHFPEQVGEVPLVEVVRGEKTSDEALARAFDYALAIRRMPIVVTDSPGLYVARLAGAYHAEAAAMLAEGTARTAVTNAGKQAGYSLAPLSMAGSRVAVGDDGTGRSGADGIRVSGIARAPARDLIDRLLFIVAIEAARCLEEGVVASTAEANVGSIMGVGYPPWAGGAGQFITAYEGGVARFVARAHELAARYGERFTPPELLA
ncbi:enoyl-CoA hydratase/isomerase family protein [Rhodococcus sp. CX]|uniref:3-hydroxyacyl-CoA dehydrogenase NAD-binding domain-containing protein n=1 Tax=Rhodococcus sp. CX TaxID=2789880 RepID=UPI0018CD42EC|nr:3-hydroxyacyl-CoA dehydrogenase NAD-binding domain-containing protein [Rhodococcus sp. CX]MBH0121600.1 enoyl-CoA hydratase/isomerase family protein [Rhodococcus sp. CX]